MPNRTYFSFRQSSDWQNGNFNNVEYDQSGLRLKREQRYRHSKRVSFNLSNEQDIWLDACESAEGWFWLNDQNQLYRYEKQFRHREFILKLELGLHEQAYRISVYGEFVYVLTNQVANEQDSDKSYLYCFYLSNGQLRWKLDSWKQSSFKGYSLVLTAAETIVILAKLANQDTVHFLQLDALGYPMHEQEVPSFNPKVSFTDYIAKWNDTYRLIAEKDKIHLFDSQEKQIIIYYSSTQHTRRLTIPYIDHNEATFTVDKEGQYWIIQKHTAQKITEMICVNDEGELVQQGQLMIESCQYVIVSKRMVVVCDIVQKVAYLLEPKQLPLFSEQLQSYRGWWVSQPLDSEEIGTEWHRFVITVKEQHDTSINVKYFASDQKQISAEQLNQMWTETVEDPKDVLFVNTIGRYMWIGIELIGTDVHTPYIDSLEVYFPRQSYVKDLPVIFQRSDQGFLTHFLSLFQTMLEDTDLKVEGATLVLEPNKAEQQSLKWLIGWLGLDTDDYWSDEQLRTLLKEAPKLMSLRGTKYAIEKLVEIYTGSKPIILEYDDIKPLKENIELGEVVDKLYAADEHTFNVLVKADDVSSELKKITLQHILDRYKPVFTTCKLVILQPWVYMDLHSYLGMNTVLTAPQQLLLNGQMSMPHHTITLDIGQQNQLDKHSRIGLNSKLE